jgi:hypothetical protein
MLVSSVTSSLTDSHGVDVGDISTWSVAITLADATKRNVHLLILV